MDGSRYLSKRRMVLGLEQAFAVAVVGLFVVGIVVGSGGVDLAVIEDTGGCIAVVRDPGSSDLDPWLLGVASQTEIDIERSDDSKRALSRSLAGAMLAAQKSFSIFVRPAQYCPAVSNASHAVACMNIVDYCNWTYNLLQ